MALDGHLFTLDGVVQFRAEDFANCNISAYTSQQINPNTAISLVLYAPPFPLRRSKIRYKQYYLSVSL